MTQIVEKEELSKLKERKKRWEKEILEPTLAKRPERNSKFITTSSESIDRLYTPLDLEGFSYENDLGMPGEFPFTRGVHETMYRGKLWTMRQFSGFGTAEQSNERYKYLLSQGTTGISVAFHLPTIMGYDSDHPMSAGEVGRLGVAIDSLQDMEILFDGIPLDKVSTSMTINAPAALLLAMYIVVAEKQGVEQDQISGTIQNDILKEYIAQKSWIFPPKPSMRIIKDILEYCAENVPRWNTISISGYHIREAGSTAVQELAFTLVDGLEYMRLAVNANLDLDKVAQRLSFFFNAHNDLFEEIAKYRAARRIWARKLKEEFGITKPRSLLLRFHTQTAGCSLTAQQPESNIIRTTIQALAAVLGGTQSLHTNSMDEAWALPSEEAVRIAVRTQQVIAFESGVVNTIDPLGGSYFVEALTQRMEDRVYKYFAEIKAQGGVLKAIENSYFQKEIAESAYRYQKEIETMERTVVGVNDFVLEGEDLKIPLLKIDPEVERSQIEKLRELRATRDNDRVQDTLKALETAAQGTENLMPFIINCVREYTTIGEICDVFREIFGTWEETPVF